MKTIQLTSDELLYAKFAVRAHITKREGEIKVALNLEGEEVYVRRLKQSVSNFENLLRKLR